MRKGDWGHWIHTLWSLFSVRIGEAVPSIGYVGRESASCPGQHEVVCETACVSYHVKAFHLVRIQKTFPGPGVR